MASNNNYGVARNWHGPSSNFQALEGELCLGDRLEFRRDAGYAHWGIYVGQYEGMRHAVIHFGTFSCKKGIPSPFDEKPEIQANTIGAILGGSGKVRINNSRDEKEEPLDTGTIIKIATKMHRGKTQIDYNLLSNNCEHFVNLCRYCHPHSEQVTDAVETAGHFGVIAVYILAIGAILGPSIMSYIKRK